MPQYDATANVDRIKAEARDICPICQQTVWLSFYFDAFGHDKYQDGDNMSNIGKLHFASIENKSKGMRPFYYPGLGTNFNPEVSVLLVMEAKKIAEDAQKAEAKLAKEMLTNSSKKVASEIWNHKEGWWKRVQDITVKDSKKLYHQYKKQLVITFFNAERRRYLRGITRFWSNFVEDLWHHPMRSLAILEKELAKQTVGYAAESVGYVRDAAWVAALFNTGVDTRLEAAVNDFKEAVAASKKTTKIKQINVAVFGADMGGALAVAFANKLLNELCDEDKYDDIEVHIRFMGLFDCVASRYDDNAATGYVQLSNSVTGKLTMHKKVERVVHFAAAHENRLYKPLSSIGGVNKPGGRLEEKLFPGTQQDVTGGYGKDEQGIDNQLSRMPLRMMLGRAWRSGVPVYTLDRLENDTSVDRRIFLDFKMDSKLSDQVYAYWNKVRELSTTVQALPAAMPELIFTPGRGYQLKGFAAPNRACAPATETDAIKVVPADIKGLLPAHMALYVAWLKHQYEKQHDSYDHIEARHIKLLRKEITQMEADAQLGPLDPGALSKEAQDMLKIWHGNSASILGSMTSLFEKHVHDSMAESVIEEIYGDFVFSRHYLHYRHITMIEQEPDRDFFESLWDKAVDATESAAKVIGKDIVFGK